MAICRKIARKNKIQIKAIDLIFLILIASKDNLSYGLKNS